MTLAPPTSEMRYLLILAAAVIGGGCSSDAPFGPEEPPVPRPDVRFVSDPIPKFGATPTPSQQAWQEMEVTAFIHFGVNTFTDREWGTGDEDPSVFNPTALDAAQWVRAARDGGIGGLILTAKHHDGFALWPSQFSSHTVAASPFRDGQGDVVRELSDAARAGGVEFGIYLSPWDRHEPRWGTPAYNWFYISQADELVNANGANYGNLFEFWIDGAHGEEVTQAQRDTYDSSAWESHIRLRQPGTLIAFSRDIQYSGTEEGVGSSTYWNDRGGYWSPIECNMPFRDGWFWHPNEDPKPLDELVDTYFRTVGRGCVLLLGLAPDRRGLIEEEDVERLREWRAALDAIFETDLAEDLPATASSVRPGSDGWQASAATDGEPDSFWAADAPTGWLEVDLEAPERVGVVDIREPIRYGQRIAAFAVEAMIDGQWREVVSGTTVGRRRALRFPPVVAQRWRLRIDDARAAPAVSHFGLYAPVPEM